MASTSPRASSDVLAVVEHQQPRPALQAAATDSLTALARLLGDAQHRGHRVGHCRRIGDRGQLENPYTVGKFIGQPRRDLHASRVLPTPPTPVNVTSRCDSHRRLDLGDLGFAADQTGGRGPQVSRDSCPAPAAAESQSAARRAHLKYRDRDRDVSQPPLPEIEEIHSAEQIAVESATSI